MRIPSRAAIPLAKPRKAACARLSRATRPTRGARHAAPCRGPVRLRLTLNPPRSIQVKPDRCGHGTQCMPPPAGRVVGASDHARNTRRAADTRGEISPPDPRLTYTRGFLCCDKQNDSSESGFLPTSAGQMPSLAIVSSYLRRAVNRGGGLPTIGTGPGAPQVALGSRGPGRVPGATVARDCREGCAVHPTELLASRCGGPRGDSGRKGRDGEGTLPDPGFRSAPAPTDPRPARSAASPPGRRPGTARGNAPSRTPGRRGCRGRTRPRPARRRP